MKKVLFIAAMFVASTASAHFFTSGANTGSPLHSATPTNISDSSVVYNVLVAEGDAARVLLGEQPTPIFELAVESAEEILEVRFDNNRDAAVAIIRLSNEL